MMNLVTSCLTGLKLSSAPHPSRRRNNGKDHWTSYRKAQLIKDIALFATSLHSYWPYVREQSEAWKSSHTEVFEAAEMYINLIRCSTAQCLYWTVIDIEARMSNDLAESLSKTLIHLKTLLRQLRHANTRDKKEFMLPNMAALHEESLRISAEAVFEEIVRNLARPDGLRKWLEGFCPQQDMDLPFHQSDKSIAKDMFTLCYSGVALILEMWPEKYDWQRILVRLSFWQSGMTEYCPYGLDELLERFSMHHYEKEPILGIFMSVLFSAGKSAHIALATV